MSAITLERRATPWMFLSPFLLVFIAFMAWPLAQSILLAMHQTYGPKTSEFVFLDNFAHLLGDPLFWKAMGNTCLFAAGSVFIFIQCIEYGCQDMFGL